MTCPAKLSQVVLEILARYISTVSISAAGLVLKNACAVKAGAFQWEIDPPGNWFVPPGNNRSGGGGNKAVGAFDVKGRLSGSVSM